jgi:hypothetical protein
METQPTCGEGLAEHAALPAKLGEWTADDRPADGRVSRSADGQT